MHGKRPVPITSARKNTDSPGASPGSASQEKRAARAPVLCLQPDDEYKVLVVNSSQEMAKEITLQLTLRLPGCSIMYAPSIELAKWILARRKIDLVVSSPMLPDGGINKLNDSLEKSKSPPDLVIVGTPTASSPTILGKSRYEFAAFRRLGEVRPKPRLPAEPIKALTRAVVDRSIEELGANLRNDLNNPLQEIVAMVFVAKVGGQSPEQTQQALSAIDKAACNMAKVVKNLEDKIRKAVHL